MMTIECCSAGDAILSSEEPDTPVAAWTLDELDHSADLASLRSALAHTDELCA